MKRILLTPPRLKKSLDRLLAGVLAFSMLLAPLPALAASPDAVPDQTVLTEPAPAETPAPTEDEPAEEPAPTPDVEPALEPDPTADTAPTPAPDPADAEEPAPEPTPDAEPEATPDPAENAAPEVTPEPAENATPETPATPEAPAPADADDGGDTALLLGEPAAIALADANGFTVENGVLTDYDGPGGNITIPDTVTEISNDVFNGDKTIKNVTLPSGLLKIDGGAFMNSTISGTLTIPSNVTFIGGSAFKGCNSLTDVVFDSTARVNIEQEAFRECLALKNVVLPKTVNDWNVSRVRENTLPICIFAGCTALETVDFGGDNSELAMIGADASTAAPSSKSLSCRPACARSINVLSSFATACRRSSSTRG